MPRVERPTSLGLGLLFLAGFGWSLRASLETITADPGSLTAAVTVGGGALMLFGGLAFAVAGTADRIAVAGRPLEWWELQSVGYAALGLYIVLSGLVQLPSVLGVLLLVGGLGITVFGYYRLRAGLVRDESIGSSG